MWAVISAIIAAAIVLVIIAVRLLDLAVRFRDTRRLRETGRVIKWEDALSQVRSGKGCFVKNETSLPGHLWWLPSDEPISEEELFFWVKDNGLLVTSLPSKDICQLLFESDLASRLIKLNAEPFVD